MNLSANICTKTRLNGEDKHNKIVENPLMVAIKLNRLAMKTIRILNFNIFFFVTEIN